MYSTWHATNTALWSIVKHVVTRSMDCTTVCIKSHKLEGLECYFFVHVKF